MAGEEINMPTRKASTFNAYRSYQHLTRVMMATCLTLGSVLIVQTCFLINLYPLKEIQPMILSLTDKENQVVRVEPIERNVQGIQLMTEKLLMRYVELRESVDGITESKRFQEIYNMTDGPLWASFMELMKPENSHSPLQEFRKKELVRSARITRCISLHASAPNTFRVEWESIDLRHGQEVDRNQWVTTIVVRFDKREVKYEDQYINPLGLIVVDYTISKKES